MTPYAATESVLDSVPFALRAVRRSRRLSYRAAAAEIGVTFTVIRQVEKGGGYHVHSLRLILQWLDRETEARRKDDEGGDHGTETPK